MKERYLQTESYDDLARANEMWRTVRLADLRDLELRFLGLPALARARPLTARRRRQELARLDFPRKLKQLRAWVESGQACPGTAWKSLVTDLRQLLDEAQGYEVRDREEATIIEKENR